jgi:hypothetical protein
MPGVVNKSAIVKERDTQLECTKIWYFFSPLLTPFLGVLTIDRTLKCQTVDIIWNFLVQNDTKHNLKCQNFIAIGPDLT